MDKKVLRWQMIEQFLQNRILAGLANEGKLVKRQEESHWAYKMYRDIAPKV